MTLARAAATACSTFLGAGKQCLFLPHDGFVRFRVDAEQNCAFFNQLIRRDVDADDNAADTRHDRRRHEKLARHVGVGVVVVHQQDQRADDDDAAKHRSRHRPLVERQLENLEDGNADCRVGENQQKVHA